MDKTSDPAYRKGYLDGYLAGLRDSKSGTRTPLPADSILHLPIQASPLSPRAKNCLHRYSCMG